MLHQLVKLIICGLVTEERRIDSSSSLIGVVSSRNCCFADRNKLLDHRQTNKQTVRKKIVAEDRS